MRLLVLCIVGLLVLGVVAAPASADCSGPSMRFTPHDVDRGGAVTLTGTGWGDNCYDTGPPPEGEGVLGRPLTGIEIVVIQGGGERVVATLDADDDHGFVAQVVVPQDAAPGEAQLIARKPGALPFPRNPDPTLRISAAPAVTPPPATSSTSPSVTTASEGEAAARANRSEESPTSWLWAAPAALVGALAVGGWAVLRHRRSR